MPKRTDISSILIIGAGPIVIGQACEFDYSGVQACKALRAEGYRIILVNSNPATIMTDPDVADATYIEPITPEMVEKIIAAERPLLRAMPGLTPYLIEVPDAGPGRAHALRAAVRHVRAGGALLTFPAGRIEADPAVLDDAQATLPLWSDMPAILRRAVPNATVVSMLVSGVTSARALHHPWVQRVPVRRDREWLAATLQLIIPWFRAPVVRVRVAIVAPHDGVVAAMYRLLCDERYARGLPPPARIEDLP